MHLQVYAAILYDILKKTNLLYVLFLLYIEIFIFYNNGFVFFFFDFLSFGKINTSLYFKSIIMKKCTISFLFFLVFFASATLVMAQTGEGGSTNSSDHIEFSQINGMYRNYKAYHWTYPFADGCQYIKLDYRLLMAYPVDGCNQLIVTGEDVGGNVVYEKDLIGFTTGTIHIPTLICTLKIDFYNDGPGCTPTGEGFYLDFEPYVPEDEGVSYITDETYFNNNVNFLDSVKFDGAVSYQNDVCFNSSVEMNEVSISRIKSKEIYSSYNQLGTIAISGVIKAQNDDSNKNYLTLTGDKGIYLNPTVNGNVIMNQGGGKVGIGLDNPGEALDVNGKIRAHEVKVCLDQGCDFVFEPDYKLMSLSDLDQFITKNKHLPEVAPAAVMEAEGIDVSEMNALLLQKVEELTLYVIKLNKEIEQLKTSK